MAIIRAPMRDSGFEGHIPWDAESEHWRMEGADPEVQTFGGAREQKTAPNWSDYLRNQPNLDGGTPSTILLGGA